MSAHRVDVYLMPVRPPRLAVRYVNHAGEAVSMIGEQRPGHMQWVTVAPEGDDWVPEAVEVDPTSVHGWVISHVVGT